MSVTVHSDKMKFSMFTFVFLLCVRVTEGSDITCVAGETAVGCTAIVTCDFGRNIRDVKQTFMIFKYPPGTINFDSDLRKDVMSCNWNSDQSLNCYVESPFVAHITSLQFVQSNGVINYTKMTSGTFEHRSVPDSSSIGVDILNVGKQHAGIYECQLVSTAYIYSTKCLLTVSETWGNRPLTDLCQDNRKPDAETSTLDKTGLIFGGFGCGVGFLCIFILFWIWWKYSLKRRSDLLPNEHDAWDDVICCRPLQRFRKPTEGSEGCRSPSQIEAPEEEKLNPGQGDLSAVVDDVDTDQIPAGSSLATFAMGDQKSSPKQKENQHSTPPEQRRAAAMTPSTQPANISVSATSSPLSNFTPPESPLIERPPKDKPPKVAENNASAKKSLPGQTKPTQSTLASSSRSAYNALTDIRGDHPLMFMQTS